MPEFRKMTESRLAEVLRRQDPPAWGKNYDPAIRATVEEAPSKSRPQRVWWELVGREIHVLSSPELWVLVIVLYCPWLWELQEQRALPFMPSPHPLSSHPRAAGMLLPAMAGTLAVADKLGYLKWHPFLRTRTVDSAVPVPWVGDLLLFLSDEEGPFCSNVSVRETRASFVVPSVAVTAKTNLARAKEKESARQETERALYAEVGIATHEIAGDELNPIIVANLQQILTWQKRKSSLGAGAREDLLGALQDGMVAGKSALEVIHHFAGTDQGYFYNAKIALYQSIWERQLKIDLFQYFFLDHPLVPQSCDVLDLYCEWFRRPKP
jgi:hypothetical protein